MRYQQATSVVAVPLAALESRLSRVEEWPAFLAGVESVGKICHERYRFQLADWRDNRDATVAVRHRPATHSFSWRALTGPSYTGRLELQAVDDQHTRVHLELSSHPGSLTAGIAEMVMPRMGLAAEDLRRLEGYVLASRSAAR
jgi:uncharacterized membrane protein